MRQTDYDVIIIGGGIHGTGCAQAAAAAGYRTLLLEQTSLASATSSQSSKLVHGGLRYLESFQFRLVAESLNERRLLLKNAPGLVSLTPFYIPVYKAGKRKAWQIYAGLLLYAFLGRFDKSCRFERLKKTEWSRLDNISKDGLSAVFRYHDGQTDDVALTKAVMHSAQSMGAELLCPARLVRAIYDNGKYSLSVISEDSKKTLTSAVLINASGPWINTVLANTTPRIRLLDIDLVKGTHIILQQPSYKGIYYVEAEDGRAVFIIPWKGKTMVGTTEKIYEGDPASVTASEEETAYLIRTAQDYFPDINTTVIDSFAGLRVLPKMSTKAFHRPRDTLLYTNDELPGMVTIAGGKLTTYRSTAEKTLNILSEYLGGTPGECKTGSIQLP